MKKNQNTGTVIISERKSHNLCGSGTKIQNQPQIEIVPADVHKDADDDQKSNVSYRSSVKSVADSGAYSTKSMRMKKAFKKQFLAE